MRFVRSTQIVLLWLVMPAVPAFAAESTAEELLAEIDHAIAAGTAFLIGQQDADGAWRSKTYGLLKDGTSLTPLVASALAGVDGRAARQRAQKWMSTWFVRNGGRLKLSAELQYPVYAAGLCLPQLKDSDEEAAQNQIAVWREAILSLQLNAANGWSPDDPQFGGWGYSHEPPTKPQNGRDLSPLDEPNLSATVFALNGLAHCDPEDTSIQAARQAALLFVSRCQNFQRRTPESAGGSRFDDGGFHFMLDDPVRNKPGIAGTDDQRQIRLVSYGSATADGLRALLHCGVATDDPRAAAAQKWLLAHFEDGLHPGAYPPDRAALKPSLDYYYAASVSRAFRMLPVSDDQPMGRSEWARRLAQRLISRQQDDGSWCNPAVDVREDDPIIATSFALMALHDCREELRRRP